MDSCKLCNRTLDKGAVEVGPPPDILYKVTCPRCGVYIIEDRAVEAEPDHYVKKNLHLISAVARWMSERKSRLQVERKLLKDPSEFETKILSMCPRSVEEKMNGILKYVADKSSYPGDKVSINEDSAYPLFYCKNRDELDFHLFYLKRNSLLDDFGTEGQNILKSLTAKGWQKVEELSKPNIESKQAFVAMWFDDEVKSAYFDGIAKLEEDTGFSMHRVDMGEFNDKICDKILAEIRRSRFIIADVTGHRHAVYFEAGFALGLGLPVIWTCREDHMSDTESKFDTRQYNHIVWTTASELRDRLKNRILATIGGPF